MLAPSIHIGTSYPGHPDAPRKDWDSFSRQLSPYFSEAISREDIELPYWLLPLARGVILASPVLLGVTGYKKTRAIPHGWQKIRQDVYQLSVGKTRLRVRPTNDRRGWIISRWPPGISMHSDAESETLAHRFGATPLVTSDLNEALHLAYWFEVNHQGFNVHWVEVSPRCPIVLLAFAMQRANREGTKLSWNDLRVSNAHSRRMKRRQTNQRHAPLLPPVAVRLALQYLSPARWGTAPPTFH